VRYAATLITMYTNHHGIQHPTMATQDFTTQHNVLYKYYRL